MKKSPPKAHQEGHQEADAEVQKSTAKKSSKAAEAPKDDKVSSGEKVICGCPEDRDGKDTQQQPDSPRELKAPKSDIASQKDVLVSSGEKVICGCPEDRDGKDTQQQPDSPRELKAPKSDIASQKDVLESDPELQKRGTSIKKPSKMGAKVSGAPEEDADADPEVQKSSTKEPSKRGSKVSGAPVEDAEADAEVQKSTAKRSSKAAEAPKDDKVDDPDAKKSGSKTPSKKGSTAPEEDAQKNSEQDHFWNSFIKTKLFKIVENKKKKKFLEYYEAQYILEEKKMIIFYHYQASCKACSKFSETFCGIIKDLKEMITVQVIVINRGKPSEDALNFLKPYPEDAAVIPFSSTDLIKYLVELHDSVIKHKIVIVNALGRIITTEAKKDLLDNQALTISKLLRAIE